MDISGIATGQQLSWNGTALVPVTEPFDVGLHLPDLSTAGRAARRDRSRAGGGLPGRLPFSGSTGHARVAATAEAILDVQKS